MGLPSPTYTAQRAYVAIMFETIGRLLEAASQTDEEIQQEQQDAN